MIGQLFLWGKILVIVVTPKGSRNTIVENYGLCRGELRFYRSKEKGPNDIFSFCRERQGFWVIQAKQETQENQWVNTIRI